jgi:hypothetical protein
MEEYKANVAKNKTSFFGKPVDPVGNTNNNTLSKTNLYFAN